MSFKTLQEVLSNEKAAEEATREVRKITASAFSDSTAVIRELDCGRTLTAVQAEKEVSSLSR